MHKAVGVLELGLNFDLLLAFQASQEKQAAVGWAIAHTSCFNYCSTVLQQSAHKYCNNIYLATGKVDILWMTPREIEARSSQFNLRGHFGQQQQRPRQKQKQPTSILAITKTNSNETVCQQIARRQSGGKCAH